MPTTISPPGTIPHHPAYYAAYAAHPAHAPPASAAHYPQHHAAVPSGSNTDPGPSSSAPHSHPGAFAAYAPAQPPHTIHPAAWPPSAAPPASFAYYAPPPPLPRAWDGALRTFLACAGLTQALRGLERDMLVLSAAHEARALPGALAALRAALEVRMTAGMLCARRVLTVRVEARRRARSAASRRQHWRR
jgi:hypothetical protein